MEKITDITKLQPGQRIVRLIEDGRVLFFEFLMIHPKHDQYILCLDMNQNVQKFYKVNVEMSFYQNYTKEDLINYRKNFALNVIRCCDEALAELKKNPDAKIGIAVGHPFSD